MFFEFTGPFKNHDLQDLLRSDENIKFPFVKRPLVGVEISCIPRTPAENDLRTRSNFVFGCDWNELEADLVIDIQQCAQIRMAGLSSVSRSCTVAISAEVNLLTRMPPSVKLNISGHHSLT